MLPILLRTVHCTDRDNYVKVGLIDEIYIDLVECLLRVADVSQ